jgi:anti-sigma factor RsiW
MNCTEWEERIALHAGGDLPAGEAMEVERHLGECAGCQVLWSGLRESLQTLRAAHCADQQDTLAPAHFTAVRARVLAELDRRRKWWGWVWAGGLGAATLAVVLGFAMWPGRTPPLPKVAMAIPPAQILADARGSHPSRDRKEAVVAQKRHHRAAAPVTRRRPPLTVKLQTSDPNIVIYWIAD